MFGLEAATRMLFNRLDDKQYSLLKTFLTFLNYCPEHKFDGLDIVSIPLDATVVKRLRGMV